MRFGIVLPTYPAGATIESVLQVAQAAEALGFDSAWTTDHVILPPEQAGPYREIFEPLMTLAHVSALTKQLTLGISVIVVPQRSGVVLAKELATLDHLCQGRLIVGVGAGWNEAEFQMLGAGDRFYQRGAYLDETLHVWRHLWETPESSFNGDFYSLPPAAFGPAPVQPGGPAVWVGGSSNRARRRAGRFGAAWHPVGISASDLAIQGALVAATAEKANRPIPEFTPRLPMQLGNGDVGQMTAGRHQVLQGEPQVIVEKINEYQESGASEIICLFGSPDHHVVIEQMRIFSSEVMPLFRNEM